MEHAPLMWPLGGGGGDKEMQMVFSAAGEPLAIFVTAERSRKATLRCQRYFRLCDEVYLAGVAGLRSGWILEDKGGGYILVRRARGSRRGLHDVSQVGTLQFSGPWGYHMREVVLHIGERMRSMKRQIGAVEKELGGESEEIPNEISFLRKRPVIRTFEGEEEEEEGFARKRQRTRDH